MDDPPPDAVPIGSVVERGDAPSMPSSTSMAKRAPVPVTLITGFLGAGKTTLVRHVLEAPHGLRIAVILNEFGEGVENAYYQDIKGLKDKSGDWVELDNGCMCCSVKSDFVKALESLLAKEKQPDYILIETTGMANPGPVASALWTDEEVEAGVQLDSIITVVDGINIGRQLHGARTEGSVNEAQVQIAYADLILLNKMDLCSDEAIVRAEADIRAINSSIHIIRTSKCAIELSQLLNRQGYKHGAEIVLPPIAEDEDEEEGEGEGKQGGGEGGKEVEEEEEESEADKVGPLGGGPPGAPCSSHDGDSFHSHSLRQGRNSTSGLCSHSRAASLKMDDVASSDGDDVGHNHSHDTHIQTVCLRCEKPVSLENVKAFMDRVLWERETHMEEVYRMKGVLCIEGDERKHMLQAVYELYSIAPSAPWLPEEARVSRVVVIGRNLKKDILAQWFSQAVDGSQ